MKTRRNILPGFGISTGITLAYVSLLILIPLSAVFLSTADWRLGAFPFGRNFAAGRCIL